MSSISEASFKLLSACEMNIPSFTVGNLIKCFSADSQRLVNEFDDIIDLLGGKFQEITDQDAVIIGMDYVKVGEKIKIRFESHGQKYPYTAEIVVYPQ